MITTEELFAEEFVPLWMLLQQKLLDESFEYAVTAGIEVNYREAAAESVRRISAKHPPRQPISAA